MRNTLCFAAAVLVLACGLWAQTEPKLEYTSPLGAKLYSLPDKKGVVAAALKELSANPKSADLLMKLEQAQVALWQEREAVETCTRALAITPNKADLYLERGHRELPLREFARARADLERAAALDPKKVDVYYHLGLAHYFLGEFAQSAEAFRHAVDLAPNQDSRINSSNWLYASLRRANKPDEAAKALAQITPEMKAEGHSYFYLSMVRFFQGSMKEADTVPAEPPASVANTDDELQFETVGYGVGNWYLYNGNKAKAQEYFNRILKRHVWITWGFVGAEADTMRLKGGSSAKSE